MKLQPTWRWGSHASGAAKNVERVSRAMNEAEMWLIRSPLLCSALQPRKHQNELLSLRRSQGTLDFSYFGQWSFVPALNVSQRGPWPAWIVCVQWLWTHTHIHARKKYTIWNMNTDRHTLYLKNVLSFEVFPDIRVWFGRIVCLSVRSHLYGSPKRGVGE